MFHSALSQHQLNLKRQKAVGSLGRSLASEVYSVYLQLDHFDCCGHTYIYCRYIIVGSLNTFRNLMRKTKGSAGVENLQQNGLNCRRTGQNAVRDQKSRDEKYIENQYLDESF